MKTGIKIVFNPESRKYEAVKVTDNVVVGYAYTASQVDELKKMLLDFCGDNIYFVAEEFQTIDGE